MAERAREETRRERASARERRRSMVSQPFEALADAVGGGEDDGNAGGPAAAAKQAARTAAAAAFAGGLAGAAKALVERRRRADSHDSDEHEEAVRDAENSAEPKGDQPEDVAGSEFDADDADAELSRADEDERPQPAAAEPEGASPTAGDGEPRRGGSASEVADVVEQARVHVANLLGREAETVSGISRTNGAWTVTVEVVDVHRIPDSTDVLSSYELVLDDDGGLVRLERRGRYRRAQVEEGR